MSGNTIYADYINMLHQADRLEDLAAMLRRKAQAAGQELEAGIRAGWTGGSAEECLRKISRLSGNAVAHAVQLERSAALLRSAAREYYRTEMIAQTLFGG